MNVNPHFMTIFSDQLNTLVASGEPEKALEELRKVLRDFKAAHPGEKAEVVELEQQIILHSARLKDLNNKERNNQLSSSEIDVSRSRMYAALLGIISSLEEYPKLDDFLKKVSLPIVKEAPKRRPIQAAGVAQPAFSGHSSSVPDAPSSSTSNNRMLIGIGGGIAFIAIVVAGFVWMGGDSAGAAQRNPSSSQEASTVIPVPQETEDKQVDSEQAAWEGIKALPTIKAIDAFIIVYPDGPHTEEAKALRDTLEARNLALEEELWALALSANTIEMYNNYLKKTVLHLYNQEAEERRDQIEEGMSEINRFNELVSFADADTLDILERLALWQSAGEDFTGEHLAHIQAKQTEYQELLTTNASITDEGNFVTCLTVSESKSPVEPGTTFSETSAYYWARINAPNPEELIVKWMDMKGNPVGSRKHAVLTNEGLGYRIYSQMRFAAPGTYEVRLYNSKDKLVARRVFTVGHSE